MSQLKDPESTNMLSSVPLIDLIKPRKKHRSDESGHSAIDMASMEPRNPFKDVTNSFTKNIEKTPPKKSPPDPMTPTTNIKMLMAVAASQEYVAHDSKSNCSDTPEIVIMEDSLDGEFSNDSSYPTSNRKQRSLALICDRFLLLYPPYPDENFNIFVSIDEAATKLSVERRRMYDVVNVLESIGIVKKVGKNRYQYFGKMKILASLKSIWEKAKISNLEQILTNTLKPHQEEVLNLSPVSSDVYQSRKEKTLGALSQKFLMLFMLLKEPYSISLQIAAQVLLGKSTVEKDSVQFKTKIRRLYDVANIFASVGLIVKDTFLYKQSFKYIGPSMSFLQNYAGGEEKEEVDELKDLFPSRIENLLSGNLKPAFLKADSKDVFPRTRSENWDSEAKRKRSSSFHRHSSLQDICAVAEFERNKLIESKSSQAAFPRIIHGSPSIFAVAIYNSIVPTNSSGPSIIFTSSS